MKKLGLRVWEFFYYTTALLLYPVNMILASWLSKRTYPGSVLHVSRLGHIPFFMVRQLKASGRKVDYMAIGASAGWDSCDYHVQYSMIPFIRIFQEMRWFWTVAARYEIVHYHFIATLGYSGWDLPVLKQMGRRIVMHFRGCDIRERKKNMELNPEFNICQKCDYYIPYEKKYGCEVSRINRRRQLAKRYGDAFLVTTPDLMDFMPQAMYLPLFAPVAEVNEKNPRSKIGGSAITLVHVTNHPGIEGSDEIDTVVRGLKEDGFDVKLTRLSGVSYDKVLEAYANSDLSVGKLKMGYYANAQIESMYCGTPAITFVHPRFMTDDLLDSGFIFTPITKLRQTLEDLLKCPDKIEKKKLIARESILRLHDNKVLAERLLKLYDELKSVALPH
ncbi:MAG: hypothetical protein PHI59_01855 [Candidatus Omnitrophica bacterium]|nr:hypothetical protein [Candidatus Omnitrophota bacterium]